MLKPVKPKPKPVSKQRGLGELALIQQIRSSASGVRNRSVLLGIGDDCAILKVRPGEELLVTTDLSLEGRHCRRDWHSAASIGHRTVARGLSDIAAMGGRPIASFLSLALPASVAQNHRWLDEFLGGLLALAKLHGVPLAGGDTSEAPGDNIIADIMLLGAAPAGRALRRSGARAGDILYCTGTLGGASTELAALAANPPHFKRAKASEEHPHLFPQPRLAAGQSLLRRKLATACIDTSDGLSTDLAHLCEASGVVAEVDLAALPMHLLAAGLDPALAIAAALHGGEDYELLFTARASTRMPRKLGGVAITPIGRIVKQRRGTPQVVLVNEAGGRSELIPQGWEHFRK